MNVLINIRSPSIRNGDYSVLSEACFELLCRLYPEGKKESVGGASKCFECTLPAEDERLKLIQDALANDGLSPWLNTFRSHGEREYLYSRKYIYDASDFQSCEYMIVRPIDAMEGAERDEPGFMRLDVASVNPSVDLAIVDGSMCAVSTRCRGWLFDDGLANIVFHQTSLVREEVDPEVHWESASWDGVCERYWELTSDLILPAMSPEVNLVDAKGLPCNGDYSRGCYLREGNYQTREPHYRRKEIEQIGTFDFALTQETFGPKRDPNHRWLIASKRVYDLFVQHEVRTNWIPVRVDD